MFEQMIELVIGDELYWLGVVILEFVTCSEVAILLLSNKIALCSYIF